VKDLLKRLVGAVAPTVASALGGPLAGAAVAALAEKLGIDTQGKSPDQLEEAVYTQLSTASPEQLLQLKQLETQFKTDMARLGLDEQRIHQLDRESARTRQIQARDKTPNILAYLTFAAFCSVLGAVIYLMLRPDLHIDESVQTVLNVMLGILLAMTRDAWAYFFGSSAGSARKTDMLTINGK